MHIIIGNKPPVQNEQSNGAAPVKPIGKMSRRDHRQNRQDRRKALRNGIIVSLSSKKERRKTHGRRGSDYHVWA